MKERLSSFRSQRLHVACFSLTCSICSVFKELDVSSVAPISSISSAGLYHIKLSTSCQHFFSTPFDNLQKRLSKATISNIPPGRKIIKAFAQKNRSPFYSIMFAFRTSDLFAFCYSNSLISTRKGFNVSSLLKRRMVHDYAHYITPLYIRRKEFLQWRTEA